VQPPQWFCSPSLCPMHLEQLFLILHLMHSSPHQAAISSDFLLWLVQWLPVAFGHQIIGFLSPPPKYHNPAIVENQRKFLTQQQQFTQQHKASSFFLVNYFTCCRPLMYVCALANSAAAMISASEALPSFP